jgi:two-component system, OmpR family, phosphate regulon sensor histidine kinase PhoR
MKWKKGAVSPILSASILGVLALIVFQLVWMRYSRRLSEELFNQRACMALCSTVENYGGGAVCNKNANGDACCRLNSGDDNPAFDSSFHAELSKKLQSYQIDLGYKLTLSEEKLCENHPYQCSVSLPTENGGTAFINLVFPEKEAFVLQKMNVMVVATLLILLFISFILLMANWALVKQKRLLQTNVDFFNNMAHEFRTPLTNIGLATNMLARKHEILQNNPIMEIIQRENAKLQAQVEQVLQLARLENGDFTLQPETLTLLPLLQSVADDMAIQIEEKNGQVRLDAVPPELKVWGDRTHLSNVLRNLVDNALKYSSDAPPVIQISAASVANGTEILVKDNGIGIPPDQCEHIFNKFQRAGEGNLHTQKGFGLGLAYAKSVLQLHKGHIKVRNAHPNGSLFEVFLPHQPRS